MQNASLLASFPLWYLKARNRHGIHSPFLYRFLDQCVYKDRQETEFISIEEHRLQLRREPTVLNYTDPGAGSRLLSPISNSGNRQREITVARLARTSLQSARFCRLLYRMVQYFQCKNILEMGTSLGITTAYLASAAPEGRVYTIEGAEPIARKAAAFFAQQDLRQVHLQNELFDNALANLAPENRFDLIYLDGDHQGNKVLEYFSILMKHIHNSSVLVLDDIRWSTSMFEAWKKICRREEVRISVDMFHLGILFFDPRLTKEHFTIRYP